MKYVVISKLLPGVDTAKHAFAVFGKVGLEEGTIGSYAGSDGKTFITIVDSDSEDMTVAATYAPFFESTTVIPVVAMDEAWMKSMQTAIGNWA